MDEHKHVWDESGTCSCSCGEYWRNYRKTLKPTPAAPPSSEETVPKRINRKLQEMGIRTSPENFEAMLRLKQDDWIEACREIDTLKASLAAQAQAVEREKSKRERAEDSRDRKAEVVETLNKLLCASEQREDALEAERDKLRVLICRLLNKVNVVTCFWRHQNEIVPGAVSELNERQILVERELAALELNSKPPLPGEKERR
jgi:hypothetical protein